MAHVLCSTIRDVSTGHSTRVGTSTICYVSTGHGVARAKAESSATCLRSTALGTGTCTPCLAIW
eukprot:1059938-Rhodomonas_salina.3